MEFQLLIFKNNLNFEFFDKFKFSSNLCLFYLAILSSLYEIVSSILCIKIVGYCYEGNVLIREVIHSFGILGFVCMKIGMTLIALLATYYIIKYKDSLGWRNVKKFYGIYVGTIISNIFVATSNLSVIHADCSFYFLNFTSLQIGVFLLFIAPLAGFFLDIFGYLLK